MVTDAHWAGDALDILTARKIPVRSGHHGFADAVCVRPDGGLFHS